MVGGCHSSIELDTANGAKLCDVSYDPGYEGNEGPGIYIMDGDLAYVMEGDQTELNDFMGQCIQDAYEQTCLPDPQAARDSGSARTWLFEDEMPGTPNREARVRRRSRDRDHHKGACPLCGGLHAVGTLRKSYI